MGAFPNVNKGTPGRDGLDSFITFAISDDT